jgi:hypothetical protein
VGTSCTPANVCHTGSTSCTTGTPVCADSGNNVADGTACGGTNKTCLTGTCTQYYKVILNITGSGHAFTDTRSLFCGPGISAAQGSVCSALFVAGSTVTIHGTPGYWWQSTANQWTGACTGYGDCVLTNLSADTTVTRVWDTVTWDPNFTSSIAGGPTYSNGNLTAKGGSADATIRVNSADSFYGTVGSTSGKGYFEIHVDSAPGSSANYGGVGMIDFSAANNVYAGNSNYGFSFGYQNSTLYSDFPTPYAAQTLPSVYYLSSGDTYMFAVDFAKGYVWIGWAGGWASGNPSTGTTPTITGIASTEHMYPAATLYSSSRGGVLQVTGNFGSTPFTFPIPTGF